MSKKKNVACVTKGEFDKRIEKLSNGLMELLKNHVESIDLWKKAKETQLANLEARKPFIINSLSLLPAESAAVQTIARELAALAVERIKRPEKPETKEQSRQCRHAYEPFFGRATQCRKTEAMHALEGSHPLHDDMQGHSWTNFSSHDIELTLWMMSRPYSPATRK